MKKYLIYVILASLMAISCTSRQTPKTGCGDLVCSIEFISIPVKLISTNGGQVTFSSYKIIDVATGKTVKTEAVENMAEPNTIIIADDNHIKDLAESGQLLQLQIKRIDGNILKVNYKVSGGKCACHVTKMDGPNEVDLNP